VMQAADHGLGNDATELLDWSRDRRIFTSTAPRGAFVGRAQPRPLPPVERRVFLSA